MFQSRCETVRVSPLTSIGHPHQANIQSFTLRRFTTKTFKVQTFRRCSHRSRRTRRSGLVLSRLEIHGALSPTVTYMSSLNRGGPANQKENMAARRGITTTRSNG